MISRTQKLLCYLCEVATAVMLFGLSSGAALAIVVGVLIEVPVMLMLVGFCKRTPIGSTGHLVRWKADATK